ncbi:ABC transporter ATP-binding protein [Rhizobium miluonense]|uniref:Spermidine/putrescine import ATP-binding protein PotA n=1 Tax=Rhizobium miluonense TaxID=411945 RepID=A0A1C3WDD4_9HYPH|nr:ABC transporter ATP-binding protein [Rhizobium miluonense]SCB37895.1 putative spermidine/putrescine transport system ATP-binding protein [Rhizobium miluonense]
MTIQQATASGGYLHLHKLSKHYTSFVGVDALDLNIASGELVALLGPSGCGKTTTLRMIAGLIPVTSGTIIVGGRDVTHMPTYKRDMGIVFQNYALFPHMTVGNNVAFGLEMRGIGKDEIATRVREALAMVRLEGKEDRRPTELSGGQQQRVALARALVIRPSILLLDEPLSNLDAKLRDEMRQEIRDIQKKLGITAIFVTHDQTEALAMCDKVAVMNSGKLMQIGTPHEIYEHPANPFVASFVGRANRIAAENAGGREYRIGTHTIRADQALSGKVQLMMRPHRISLLRQGDTVPDVENVVSGIARAITYIGDVLQIGVLVDGTEITVERSTRSRESMPQEGETVRLAWSMVDTLVFRED